jgi:hypothetical protein
LVAAVKAMGYTDDAIATQIAKKLAPSATNQASKNMVQRFLSAGWEGIKNNWKTILAVVGASTALYYLYKYFNRKDITSLPMCIKKKAMEDEILEMANNGFDYINIGVIGNAEIDAMGGAKFWLDGNVVQLPNGGEGNWKVVGRRLTISAAGKTYDIECLDFDGGGGNTGGGGGVTIIPAPPSKYNNCTNLPMAMYCSSDKIREVQECLGITADGKFGPQTRNALKSSGYGDGTILTEDYFNAIIANCGKEGGDEGPTNTPETENGFTPTFITPTEWLDQK